MNQGDLGDFSVFCHRNDDVVIVTLYLSEELTKVYKGFEFRSFSSDKDYGRIMGKEIDTTIKEIVNQMNDLGQEAYYEYLGPVEKLCDNENASENEVGLMLDYLFDFCGNDKVLGLYKKVCRTFYKKYPGCIAEYIMQYRMEYDTEPSDY